MPEENANEFPSRDFKISMAAILSLPPVWPPKEPFDFPEIQLPYGRIFLAGDTNGRLEVWYLAETVLEHGKSKVKASKKFKTSRVEVGNTRYGIIEFNVENDTICSVHIDNILIFGEEVSGSVTLNRDINKDKKITDFSKENMFAFERRQATFGGLGSGRLRDHPGISYDFEALNGECRQIRDLLIAISAGSHYHIPGLLARVRTVLFERDGLALLQLCAAHLESKLLFELHHFPVAEQLARASATMVFAPISSPGGIVAQQGGSEIDLDVWLDQTGLSLQGNTFSNRKVIQELGNGLGAHRTPKSNQITRAMLGRPPMPGPKALDLVGMAAVNLGGLVLELGPKLLIRFEEVSKEQRQKERSRS